MTGFQSAEHPGTDPGGARDIRQRQILALAHTARDCAQLPADVSAALAGAATDLGILGNRATRGLFSIPGT